MKKYVAKRIKNIQKNIVVWYNLKNIKEWYGRFVRTVYHETEGKKQGAEISNHLFWIVSDHNQYDTYDCVWNHPAHLRTKCEKQSIWWAEGEGANAGDNVGGNY